MDKKSDYSIFDAIAKKEIEKEKDPIMRGRLWFFWNSVVTDYNGYRIKDIMKTLERPTSIEYLTWLHDLVRFGYKEGISIETDHEEEIDVFYKSGLTPAQALRKYKEL
jgi:hypothetical protein